VEQVIVGVDIGGTFLRMGAVDDKGDVWESSSCRTLGVSNEEEDWLGDLVAGYITGLGYKVLAVSVGIPGTLSAERDEAVSVPNVSGLNGLRAQTLSDRLGLPVYFEKDANMLLLNDIFLRKVSTEDRTIVGIYFGTGIGNAVLIDDRLITGKNGAAGELGHIPCLGKKKRCSCGNTGCLEMYAGGKVLKELQQRSYPDEDVADLFARHPDDTELADFVEAMAVAMATEVTLFDPDTILLGGGVLSMPGFPLDTLCQKAREMSRHPVPAGNMELILSDPDDGKTAGLRGAALYGWRMWRRQNA